MRRRWTLASVVASGSLAALSGCGTLMNMQEHPNPNMWLGDDIPGLRVYGGIRYDLATAGRTIPDSTANAEVFLIDLPFSLVTDTLTLPFTTCAAIERYCGVPRGYREGCDPEARAAKAAEPKVAQPAPVVLAPTTPGGFVHVTDPAQLH